MQRIRFFDIAKGIAILAVILGHSAIEANVFIPHHTAQLVVAVCFSFHMPLFFILSGYFMHPERSFRWAKEAKQLLCTYAVTGVAVLVGVTCMATINHEGRAYMLRRWGEAVLYGSGDISDRTLWPVELRIGAIWFLLALFWAHLLLHAFAKLPYTPVWWCPALRSVIFPPGTCGCLGACSRVCARSRSYMSATWRNGMT